MNVFEAESGSFSNPRTACCAATKALVVLMFKSRAKSACGRDNGLFASFEVAAAALEMHQLGDRSLVLESILTVVNDDTRNTQ